MQMMRQKGGMFGGQQQPQPQPQMGQGQQTGQPDQQDHHGGFSPWMMLSPLIGAFASGHPNIGLGMISPGLGIARALGAFK
jgi:hypothetical protein